jgi:hypothetical protein
MTCGLNLVKLAFIFLIYDDFMKKNSKKNILGFIPLFLLQSGKISAPNFLYMHIKTFYEYSASIQLWRGKWVKKSYGKKYVI